MTDVNGSSQVRDKLLKLGAEIKPKDAFDVILLDPYGPIAGSCARNLATDSQLDTYVMIAEAFAETRDPSVDDESLTIVRRSDVHRGYRCLSCGLPVRGHER